MRVVADRSLEILFVRWVLVLLHSGVCWGVTLCCRTDAIFICPKVCSDHGEMEELLRSGAEGKQTSSFPVSGRNHLGTRKKP